MMVAFGYAQIGNKNYLYVCTGINNPPIDLVFKYVPWEDGRYRMRSVIMS